MGDRKKGLIAAGVIGAGFLAAMAAFSRRAEAGTMKTKTKNQKLAVALAVKYAKLFGAPPSLAIAVIDVESKNDPNAVNLENKRGGAWGFGQMTLETAKDLTKRFPVIARKYWPKFDGTGQSLLDPETNVAISTFQVSLLWKRYKDRSGNWLTAGLAYHQGSGNVDRFIAEGKGKIDPNRLPPKGTTYYGWLKNQIARNPVVAKAITTEQKSGVFTYA